MTSDNSGVRRVVFIALALVVGVAGWFMLFGGDEAVDDAAPSEEAGERGDTGDTRNTGETEDADSPSAMAALETGDGYNLDDLAGVDSIEFPLFADADPHLIVARRGAEVLVVDAQSGAVQTLDLRSDASYSSTVDAYSIGVVLERLLVVDSGIVRSFSLTGGADFELSGNVAAFDVRHGPRVVVESALSGRRGSVYEIQAFSSYGVFPSESGIVPVEAELLPFGERVFYTSGGNIYERREERNGDPGDTDSALTAGFTLVATGAFVGAGHNHVLVDRCDDALLCERVLVAADGAETVAPLPSGQIRPKPLFRLSPDGAWAVATSGALRLWGTAEGVELLPHDIGATMTTTSFSWTADSSYMVAAVDGGLVVFDLSARSASLLSLDEVAAGGRTFDEVLVVPTPPGWETTGSR